jgi:hypothetical protein
MFKNTRKVIPIIVLLSSCWTGMVNAKESGRACSHGIAPCDVAFTATPVVAPMCTGGTIQSPIFTIRNNTPVTMKLNSINVLNTNGTTNSSATVGIAPTNNCGTSLAAGASCNIQVDINPASVETFNLLLRVGVNSRQVRVETPINTSVVNCLSVTTRPTFTDLCINGTETGVFTFTNASSIPVGINSILIQSSDLLPAGVTSINPAFPNSCNTSTPVGLGQSCNVEISIQPGGNSGIIARTIEVSANNNQQILVEPISLMVLPSCSFIYSLPFPFVPPSLLCSAPSQLLTYTIKNNDPTHNPEQVTSIVLQNNGDGLPATAAEIVAGGTCGAAPFTLATGASCTIMVQINPSCSELGTLNRTLIVNTADFPPLSAPTITTAITGTTPLPPNYLGNAAACAVLGGTTVTNVPALGTVVTNGDVCVSPGTSITGFNGGEGVITPPGDQESNTTTAQNAQADLITAIATLSALPCPGSNNLTGQDLGGKTLTAGVYCFNSTAQLTGILTLSGGPNDVFVFQIGSALTTASASQVILEGGVLPANIYWVEASSATMGTGTQFQGNILAGTSITMNTTANLQNGRALARAAVTLDNNAITAP